MIYKFTGKSLFYMASVVCFLTIIFVPLGIFFIWAAQKAQIRIESGTFYYTMFGTKAIPFSEMTKLELLRTVQVRYQLGYTIPTFATVVPMQITYGSNKKVKFSLNYFEKPEELAAALQKESGLKLEGGVA